MSKITDVCVYSDRVLVTREISVSGIDSNSKCEFSKLTPRLIRDSVRVKGSGDLIILDNSLNETFLEETNLEVLNKLNDKIQKIKNKQESIQRDISKFEELNTFLELLDYTEYQETNNFLPLKKYKTEELPKLFHIYSQISEKARIEIDKLNIENREIEKKLSQLNFQADQLTDSSSKSFLSCSINFRINSKEDAIVKLFYLTSGASWTPLYDGRLMYDKKEFELLSFAEVIQETGENWENVKLELSTAKPASGALLPEPEPWYLKIFIPTPPPPLPRSISEPGSFSGKKKSKKSSRSKSSLSKGDFELSDAMLADDAECEVMEASIAEPVSPSAGKISEDSYSTSEAISTGFNVTFKSGSSHDIPPDGRSKKVMLNIKKFPVEYEYIIMPGVKEAAYLKISMTNNLDYPLLQGPIKVFRDYDYTGESKIKNTVPGEKLELYMGIDDKIKIKRDLLNRYKSKKGLTGKDTSIEYTYKLVIESFKLENETVTVLEQVPVSKNKEIIIKITEQSDFEDADEEGIMKMSFLIKPKEKKEFIYSFSVRYPIDEVVAL
jgi:uncharacterized protein (TIGR02231 family)